MDLGFADVVRVASARGGAANTAVFEILRILRECCVAPLLGARPYCTNTELEQTVYKRRVGRITGLVGQYFTPLRRIADQLKIRAIACGE
jgi:hypothetical protein